MEIVKVIFPGYVILISKVIFKCNKMGIMFINKVYTVLSQLYRNDIHMPGSGGKSRIKVPKC